MKESYGEGVATHTDPCGAACRPATGGGSAPRRAARLGPCDRRDRPYPRRRNRERRRCAFAGTSERQRRCDRRRACQAALRPARLRRPTAGREPNAPWVTGGCPPPPDDRHRPAFDRPAPARWAPAALPRTVAATVRPGQRLRPKDPRSARPGDLCPVVSPLSPSSAIVHQPNNLKRALK
jgi:hypothetical protein